MINRFVLSLMFFGMLASLRAQDFGAYEKREFSFNNEKLPYRILFPEEYNPQKKYPLIIFLHGSGQRGNDNEQQLIHGGDFFLKDSIRKEFPAIVLFPQCGLNASWSYFGFTFDTVTRRPNLQFTFRDKPAKYALLVKSLADSLVKAGLVKTDQIYIGGLSLGGFGTYDFIERYPHYFAAAFPICGGGDTSLARTVARQTAVWIFHGASDPLVSVQYARQYYQALVLAKADVRYSEYPGVKHNSWENAFREPGLMEWLFTKRGDKD